MSAKETWMARDLFPGFEARTIDVGEARIFCRIGGEGPPVVLLHGFPQTHVIWHRIAPALMRDHTLVIPDLRGYGWSSVPPSTGGARYTKSVMGDDIIRLMENLGHARFAFVGHDRGARVGYRMALEHPGRLTRLALLDILPTVRVWAAIKAGSMAAAHWAFLAGPEPEPETEILRDPGAYFDGLLAKWSRTGDLTAFDRTALTAYRMGSNEPSRIHAFCEDYRAGATLDLAADEADLATGRTIRLPTLVVWGDFYLTGRGTDPLAAWRETFAPDATGAMVKSGHFVAEEDPDGTLALLQPFLQG
jgi:haloacetate dehalogenase